MDDLPEGRTRITAGRLAALFCLFLLIALGLGYPTLNRYDPRQTPGLADVRTYSALVTGTADPDNAAYQRFRVLVPWVARPFYRMAKGRVGSWDPIMFGLLVANSLFVAATAVLIVALGNKALRPRAFGAHQFDSYTVSLIATLLYLLNFAVPNLRLAGLVDAGEGFFLFSLLWILSEPKLWALPVIAAVGALTKESFIPVSVVFTTAWWLVVRKVLGSPTRSAIWIVGSWATSFAMLIGLQWWIGGCFASPIEFAASLHGNHEYARHFISSLGDRTLWYTFVWLLPLGIPNLRRFPKSWLIPTGSAVAMVFILDAYHGGPPGGVARALFSVTGPVLALSSGLLLAGIRGGVRADKAGAAL